MQKPLAIESTTFGQWEQAGAALRSAVSRFSSLSSYLETECTTRHIKSAGLAARIDDSICDLQTVINRQLTRARIALAKTRNRLASHSTILSLPEEIITKIFLNVIYDPPGSDYCTTTVKMNRRINLIYSRLHSLLGVCTTWRTIGISCGPLWKVVPVIETVYSAFSPSTDISLRRAGSVEWLHLAMSIGRNTDIKLGCLQGKLSRFDTINIQKCMYSAVSLSHVLQMLLEEDGPRSLSKLSLKHFGSWLTQPDQPTELLNDWFVQSGASDYATHWANITFSSRLVTLYIGRISFGPQPGINNFISALASATELRNLTLVSIRAVLDPTQSIFTAKSILPKLQSLQLHDLIIDVLFLFIQIIVSQSYHLTLNLSPCMGMGFIAQGTTTWNFNLTHSQINARLKEAKIDKLVLDRGKSCAWESGVKLQTLLQSVTSVKTLVLNFYELNQDTLKSFKPPPEMFSSTSTRDDIFPQLEAIEIHCCTFKCPLGDLRTGFEDLLANHPIQRLVLGRYFKDLDSGLQLDSAEDEETLKWLERTVPRFCWLPRQTEKPDSADTWQLWDV